MNPNVDEIVIESGNFWDILLSKGTYMINLILYVAGAVAIGFLIYNALTMITASGQQEKIEGAKKMIIYNIIGIVIITLSIIIVNSIISIIQ